jgi:hypothetical protein
MNLMNLMNLINLINQNVALIATIKFLPGPAIPEL